ncbi:hypothetical protein [Acinetobacter sp. HY1485]|uniref:hypothetical protein n=1 Tax=Acinetobacter sp. HY1485 TaxID=2970918 RepID=UPI0022B9B283|nr:hypothetical protein [Acinetobacter sp. HY1485]
MIQFSTKTQQFYDTSLDYTDLPDDLVAIDEQQHKYFLDALNEGRYILDDFSFSPPRPHFYMTWVEGEWRDTRSDQQKQDDQKKCLLPLTRRQFKLVLLQYQLLEKIEQLIDQITDKTLKFKMEIEYQESTTFERNSESVSYMCQLLQLSDDQIDTMWQEAMNL